MFCLEMSARCLLCDNSRALFIFLLVLLKHTLMACSLWLVNKLINLVWYFVFTHYIISLEFVFFSLQFFDVVVRNILLCTHKHEFGKLISLLYNIHLLLFSHLCPHCRWADLRLSKFKTIFIFFRTSACMYHMFLCLT